MLEVIIHSSFRCSGIVTGVSSARGRACAASVQARFVNSEGLRVCGVPGFGGRSGTARFVNSEGLRGCGAAGIWG